MDIKQLTKIVDQHLMVRGGDGEFRAVGAIRDVHLERTGATRFDSIRETHDHQIAREALASPRGAIIVIGHGRVARYLLSMLLEVDSAGGQPAGPNEYRRADGGRIHLVSRSVVAHGSGLRGYGLPVLVHDSVYAFPNNGSDSYLWPEIHRARARASEGG